MHPLPFPPTVDPLERRLLLTALASSSAFLPAQQGVTVALKTGHDDRGDDQADEGDKHRGKGKKKGKTKGAPEISVRLKGASLADNTASVDFGRVTLGESGVVRSFVIQNEGKAALTIGSVSLPWGFSLLDAPAGRVNPGGATTFAVRLDSASVGNRSGEISFSTNDADENPFNFALHGTVAALPAPELAVLQGGRALAGNAWVDFGSAAQGSGGVVRTFTVRNDGGAALTLSRFRLPAGFSLIDAPGASLAPGDSDRLSVRLDASSIGAKSGQLTFRSNDADEGSMVLRLSGNVTAKPITPPTPPVTPPVVTAPRASVWMARLRRSALPVADGQVAAIQFAPAAIGGRAPTRTFSVVNQGNATLRLGAVQLPAGFRLVEPLDATLAPGQSDDFSVALDTSAVAVRRGQISFSTSDARASVFNFSVAGAVAARIAPSTVGLNGTTLVVNGTAGNDIIVVSGKSSATSVTINGKAMAGSPFAGVTKIVVNAGGGDDRVDLSRLFLNATANGGPGNDILIGTAGNDVLNGEAGNDNLAGGPGEDNLLGGDGDDTLGGGAGVDVLHGESGNDVLNAIDGISDDLLDSGGGADVVHRDRVDPAAV